MTSFVGPLSRHSLPLGRLLPILALLAISLTLFPSAGRDDSYMTYWPAYALSKLGEIVNLNGDRVEQSSSLLLVLVLAAASKITTLAPPTMGPIVSIVASVFALSHTHRLASLVQVRNLAVFAAVFVATSPYFAYWSTSGQEATMTALLYVALSYYCISFLEGSTSRGTHAALWVVMAMALAVRPESLAVIGSALIGGLVLRRGVLYLRGERSPDPVVRGLMYFLFVVAVTSFALFLFRLLYFGAWFPQPVEAKVTGLSIDRLVLGLKYLHQTLSQPHLVIVAVLAAAGGASAIYRFIRRGHEPFGPVLLTMLLLAHLGFVVVSGGDWMEGGRFIVPVVPVLAVLAVLGLSKVARRQFVLPALLALAAVHLIDAAVFMSRDSQSKPLWDVVVDRPPVSLDGFSWFDRANVVHLRDISMVHDFRPIIDALGGKAPAPIKIMSGQMGMVAYYMALDHFGDIEFVDRWGLATTHFATCPVTNKLPGTAFGRDVPYWFFFNRKGPIESKCGIAAPEIIFDVAILPARVRLVDDSGYEIVFTHSGQFVAVRDDLAEHLAGRKSGTP